MINAIRYADDKAVASTSQPGLQRLINNVNKVTTEFVSGEEWWKYIVTNTSVLEK